MYKTANCINMLIILLARDIVPISTLAIELNTNPRNIPEYRKELEAAGYGIETIGGRYGGYRLKKTDLFPTLALTDEEKKALVESYDYIIGRNDFPYSSEYKSAMEKVIASVHGRKTDDSETLIIPRYSLAMSYEDIKARYNIISACITNQTTLNVKYRSNDNVVRQRCIHPYKLYMYNNAWFVLAYCESVKDIRYFKLNRIVWFEATNDKFEQIYSYRTGGQWKEWLGDDGMKKNGEWYHVKLKFTGKYAMIAQDFRYGRNQVTECVDQNTTVLSMEMQYKDNIANFVLSFGGFCEVIEPQWLNEEVLLRCEQIKQACENTPSDHSNDSENNI